MNDEDCDRKSSSHLYFLPMTAGKGATSGLNDVRPANRTIMLGLKVRFDALVVESVHARQPTQHLAVFKFTQTYDALLFPTSASTSDASDASGVRSRSSRCDCSERTTAPFLH